MHSEPAAASREHEGERMGDEVAGSSSQAHDKETDWSWLISIHLWSL